MKIATEMENLHVVLLLVVATATAVNGGKLHQSNDLQFLTDMDTQSVDEMKMKGSTTTEILALRGKLYEQELEMKSLKIDAAKMANKIKEYDLLEHQRVQGNEEVKDTLTKQEKLISILREEIEELKGTVSKQGNTIKEGEETETGRTQGKHTKEKPTKENFIQKTANITGMRNYMDFYLSNIANSSPVTNIRSYRHYTKVRSSARAAREVAFSAYLSQKLHITSGHMVKCDQVLTNVGKGYNQNTGIFSVPTTGFYLLLFNVATCQGQSHINVNLLVDNRLIVSASADPGPTDHVDQGGNSAIVQLTVGESVWLEVYDSVNGQMESTNSFRLATFSGVLLL